MFPDLQFWSCPLTLSLFHFSDIYKTYFALECFNNFQKSDHLCPFWFFIFHQTALSPEWTLLYPKLSSALHKYSSAYIENLIKKSAESILVQLDPHWQNDHPIVCEGKEIKKRQISDPFLVASCSRRLYILYSSSSFFLSFIRGFFNVKII